MIYRPSMHFSFLKIGLILTSIILIGIFIFFASVGKSTIVNIENVSLPVDAVDILRKLLGY